MAKKNNFLMYVEDRELIEYLDGDQVKELILALMDYQAGNETNVSKDIMQAFLAFKKRLNHDNQKYEDKCQSNRENIQKRWNTKDTSEYERIRTYTNDTDTDIDTDIDTDTDSVVVAPTPADHQMQQIMDAWNEIPHTVKIKAIVPMTKRYDELRVVLSMVGMDGVMEAIQRVKESDYLSKRGHVVFDRYINRNVVQGLLEGSYDEDYTQQTGGSDYGLARDW